jgi:cell fate (sporulation/competence/biofilm development) regulator YlbF (YheA/YmcA/DUF963 family)
VATTLTKRDLFALARELSQALAQCEELQAWQEAEDAMLNDPEAMAIIDAYEQSKKHLKVAARQGMQAMEAAMNAFMDAEERLNNHPGIQAYKAARDRLDALVEQLNAIITFPIFGEEAPKRVGCGSGGGCGGGGG